MSQSLEKCRNINSVAWDFGIKPQCYRNGKGKVYFGVYWYVFSRKSVFDFIICFCCRSYNRWLWCWVKYMYFGIGVLAGRSRSVGTGLERYSCLFFSDRVSLCSSYWPTTCCVDHKLKSACLCLWMLALKVNATIPPMLNTFQNKWSEPKIFLKHEIICGQSFCLYGE